MAMIIGLNITDMLPASPDRFCNGDTITDSHWIINTLTAADVLYHRYSVLFVRFNTLLAIRQPDKAHGDNNKPNISGIDRDYK